MLTVSGHRDSLRFPMFELSILGHMTNPQFFLSFRNHERRDPCHRQGSQQDTWQDGMARSDR